MFYLLTFGFEGAAGVAFLVKKIGSVHRCELPEVLFCQHCPGKFLVQNRCIQQSGINKQQEVR